MTESAMRRGQIRASVAGLARLEGDDRPCQVANLSMGGCLLLGATAYPEGARLRISLIEQGLEMEGVVVRHHRASDGLLGLGVQFVDKTVAQDAALSRLLLDAFAGHGAKVLSLVKAELHKAGTTDLQAVSAELHALRERQAALYPFCGDFCTQDGSDAATTILSGEDDEMACIVWSLNLYLGLNRHPRVIEKVVEAVRRFGTGAGTSPPSGGACRLHQELKTRIARLVGKPSAVLFSTGFTANLGALSALPGPKDLLILDRESHASMFDGVKLSGKKWITFAHNDVDDLEAKLAKYGALHENVFVVVEGAYSMSGDLAPLDRICALKARHRFLLFVDEAHTFGFYGPNGAGRCAELGVTDQVDFIMSTLSKAAASIGGFVAASEAMCSYLKASATAFIFQAALPPADVAATLAALDEMEQEPAHAARLHENNRLMRAALMAQGFDLGTSQSPVVPVYVADVERLYILAAALYRRGVFTVPITYPAVGVNEGRLRFIVNAHHTPAQIERTVTVLAEEARGLGLL